VVQNSQMVKLQRFISAMSM